MFSMHSKLNLFKYNDPNTQKTTKLRCHPVIRPSSANKGLTVVLARLKQTCPLLLFQPYARYMLANNNGHVQIGVMTSF